MLQNIVETAGVVCVVITTMYLLITISVTLFYATLDLIRKLDSKYIKSNIAYEALKKEKIAIDKEASDAGIKIKQ